MIIPDDKIAEVRERAGIVEVVSDYIQLRKSGANFQGLCPFHGEKTPSFNVNPQRGMFHCFGCGESGNAISFVMKMEGIPFPEAVKILAKRVGVQIDERPVTAAEKKRLSDREEQMKIAAAAARYYGATLIENPDGSIARAYLEKRGVESEHFTSYRLGYATERWDGLVGYLKKGGFSLDHAEKLGLIRKGNKEGFYDLFRNRLLFTIADVHGQPIGFGGRVLDNSLPKYINSPESPIYQKSDTLFGIDMAKSAIRESGEAIVVEGYFDHLALYLAGIRNVVATCGTALTKGHLDLLKRYAKKIYLLFDGDDAGEKAVLRAADLILPEKLPCFVVELSEGDDPDSYLAKHSASEFLEQLSRAKPVLEHLLRTIVAKEDTGSVTGKKRVVDHFRPFLQKVTDPVERELYLRELSRLIAVDVGTLSIGTGGSGSQTPQTDVARLSPTAAESILALVVRYQEIGESFVREALDILPASLAKKGEIIARGIKGGGTVDLEALFAESPSPALAALLLDDSSLDGINPQKAFSDLLKGMAREDLRGGDAKSLRRELMQLDTDSPRYWEVLSELNNLRDKKSQLS